ncbi:MAG: ATP-dependent zinc metalloprotease FtsH [Candidatus Poribacteria bacterium]|nr:ATP-dependent zinc metalloprotease FtsH [Candidatus Poribacteria bacterium]
MSKNAKSGLVWLVIIAIIAFAVWNMIVSKETVYSLAASDFYSLVQRKDSRNLFDVTYKIKIGKESIEGKFRNVAEIIDLVSSRSPEILNIGDAWQGEFKTSRDMFSNYPLQQKLIEYGIPFDNELSSNFPQWLVIFGTTILPIVLFIGIMVFISRQMQGAGNRAMSFGKSRARLHSESQSKKTFEDVAGCDEAKEGLEEVILFLQDPKRFQKLGGRIPKGVLLMGPPGTGKTLLARAVAGEADVPFYSISGSDFVEMFVGVGASRVRDLFETGKKNAPCIVFIDELDAVGRHRGAGIGGGHDEREQTLNQLLVEMDGFDTSEGVILGAATNRPDVLDPALLRPGRFDRQIVVDLPTVKGREEIFKVHSSPPIKLGDDVDMSVLARSTPYFSGADIANMVNEAALLAAKEDKEAIDQACLDEAKDRVMMGPERRSMMLSDEERQITAYHEAGHAILNHFLPESDPNYKCTIIPRGRALGVTIKLPQVERHNYGKKFLLSEIVVLLGGRVAEEIMFGEQTTGAQNDFERSTSMARKMVMQWGMSQLGPLAFGRRDEQVFLGKEISHHQDYSEDTAIEIDRAVKQIINECYDQARTVVETNLDGLKKLAAGLLEHETLALPQIVEILGPRPQPSS